MLTIRVLSYAAVRTRCRPRKGWRWKIRHSGKSTRDALSRFEYLGILSAAQRLNAGKTAPACDPNRRLTIAG
jgi:hypothetical protein